LPVCAARNISVGGGLSPLIRARRWINDRIPGYHFRHTLVQVFRFEHFGMARERVKMSDATENPSGGTEMTVTPWRAVVRARWAEIMFISGLSLYAVLAVLAHRYAYFKWDVTFATRVQAVDLPGFSTLMIWVSLLGSGWAPTALVSGAGLGMILARFRLEGTVCMIGVALGAAMNRLLKNIIGRPRPVDTLVNVITPYNHESFPSGHVVFFVEYFGFLFFLAYVLLRRGRLRRGSFILLGLLIVLVGVSRIYMGAHWPSDVIGAYLAGGIWLMLMIEIYRRLKARQTTL
jgi:membrane-associated phospholipid phosphatase